MHKNGNSSWTSPKFLVHQLKACIKNAEFNHTEKSQISYEVAEIYHKLSK